MQKGELIMKTMIRFFTVLVMVGFVVGASEPQQKIQVPGSLEIGTAFPGKDVWIDITIGWNDPTNSMDPLYTNVLYGVEMGKIEDSSLEQVRRLAKRFVMPVGAESYDYWISVGVYKHLTTLDGEEAQIPIAGNFPGWNPEPTFRLENLNGKWVIPEKAISKVVVGYQLSGIRAYVPGLSQVEVVVEDEFGVEKSREISENGITDKTCSQYPGGSAYLGPDWLEVPLGIAYPTYYEGHRDYSLPKGYYLLKFGNDKALWAKYDLETGRKIGSNEPKVEPTPLVPVQLSPLQLEISLVDLADIRLAGFSKKNSASRSGLKLLVKGPSGRSVVLEYADAINGGWKKLTDVSLVYGLAEHVDELVPATSARFYRVR